MNKIEEEIINYNAIKTLEILNKYFIKKRKMSKDVFMELQFDAWKETKKHFNILL